ncbi:MAG: rhodanese-like domain-containing protein [Planctomycetota bacterium]
MIQPLSPPELKQRLDAGEKLQVLDVREHQELRICALPGAYVHIPLGELALRAAELDPDAPTVCVCHHGIRSAGAARYLAEAGFEELYNLTGGVDRWAAEVDPAMRRY